MRRLDEICLDLKELLSEHFATVRITSAQVSEQFLLELKAIHPAKLPAVVIVFEQGTFTAENSIRESRLSLVLLDAFTAGSQARSLSVFEEFEKLLAIFSERGIQRNNVFYLPVDYYAASADKNFACLALTVLAKQGAEISST